MYDFTSERNKKIDNTPLTNILEGQYRLSSKVEIYKFVTSLFEKHDHWIPNVQANIATIIMSDTVSSLFNDKAMPVFFILSIKLFFDFTGDV